MATDSEIGWTDDTVNGWWGCDKVSPACRFCYAENWSQAKIGHLSGGQYSSVWGRGAPRWLRVDKAIKELERSARRGRKAGRPRFVFMQSMSDLFEDREDLVAPREQLWQALLRICQEGGITPLLLTKRPHVMLEWARTYDWPRGAWAGVTAEDQQRADERLPLLMEVQGVVRSRNSGQCPLPVTFASCEGLLGPLQLDDYLSRERQPYSSGLRWVIVGGESGGGHARPMLPSWARGVRTQCLAYGVPFFFKQWGTWAAEAQLPPGPRTTAAEVRHELENGKALPLYRWGSDKRATGDLLDGQRWNQRPPRPALPAQPFG